MYVSVNVINTHNEKVVRIFNTEDIVLIGEEHQEPTRLYNENGDLVSETPATDKIYFVLMARCGQLRLDQEGFDTLSKILIPTNQSK